MSPDKATTLNSIQNSTTKSANNKGLTQIYNAVESLFKGVVHAAELYTKDLTTKNAADLVGRHFTDVDDLAVTMLNYRNRNFETQHVALLDMETKEVLETVSVTNHMTSLVILNVEQQEMVSKMADKWEKQTGHKVGIILTHNHPSGKAVPSGIRTQDGDIGVTKDFAANEPRFIGHLVTDHDHYSIIAPNGSYETKYFADEKADPLATPTAVPHGLLGRNIRDAIDLRELGQEIGVTTISLVGLDTKRDVASIIEIPSDALLGYLDDPKAMIKAFQKLYAQHGISLGYLYLPTAPYGELRTALEKMIVTGLIENAVWTEPSRFTKGVQTVSLRDFVSRNKDYLWGVFIPEWETKGGSVIREPIDEPIPPHRDRKPFQLPEILELYSAMQGGKVPAIRKILKEVLNHYFPKKDWAALLKDMPVERVAKALGRMVGQVADSMPDDQTRGNILGHIASLVKYTNSLLAEYEGAPGKVLTDADRTLLKAEAERLAKEAEQPDRVIITEILREVPKYTEVGVTPDMILDIMRGITNEPDNILLFMKRLSGPEKAAVVKAALKGVVDERLAAMGGRVQTGTETVTERTETRVPGKKATAKEINARFRQLVKDEIAKRRLFQKEVITKELKDLSKAYEDFNLSADPKYTAMRFSASRLYQDAVSALLNDPALLHEKAPTFERAFFNYLDRKPDFQATYVQIESHLFDPETVLANTRKRMEEMQLRGAKRMAEQRIKAIERHRTTFGKLWHEMKRYLWNEKTKADEMVKFFTEHGAEIRDEDNPVYWLEKMPLINGVAGAFTTEVDESVIKPALAKGATINDLGLYMLFKREETERAGMLNPGGVEGERATAQLDEMKRNMGEKRFNATVDAVELFQKMYRKHVLDIVARADFLPKHLINKMLANQNYATFAHIDYEKEMSNIYGSLGQARIYQQYGGLGDVPNVFMQTVMKGQALIRASMHHETKMKLRDFLAYNGTDDDIKAAKKDQHGWDASPEGMGIVYVSPGGVLQPFHVDKEFADLWNFDPDKAMAWINMGLATKAVLARLFIQWNPAWLAANIPRDFLGTWAKTDVGLARLAYAYIKTAPDALLAGFGYLPEREQRMIREQKIMGERFYNDERFSGIEQEAEWLEKHGFEFPPMFKNKALEGIRVAVKKFQKSKYEWLTILPPVGRFISHLGMASERWSKFAGEEAIKTKLAKTGEYRSPEKIANDIRTKVGTPYSYNRGKLFRGLEFFFPFSNIGVQGIRSAAEAFRERKATTSLKLLIGAVLPKVIFALMVAGWFGDDMKEVAKKAGKYIRRMYAVLPLWRSSDGKGAWFFTMPQSYESQAIGAVVDSLITGEFTGALGTLGLVTQATPYNLNPFVDAAIDIGAYYGYGTIPINQFYNSPMMTDQEASAGGMAAAAALGRSTWNSFFGSLLYRFEGTRVLETQNKLNEAFQMGPLKPVGRFFRYQTQGVIEEAAKASGEERTKRAKMAIKRKEEMVKDINLKKTPPTEGDAINLWLRLVGQGVFDSLEVPPKDFVDAYMLLGRRQAGDPDVKALSTGRSSFEQAAILRHWEATMSPKDYKERVEKLTKLRVLSPTVLLRMQIDEYKAKK